MQDDLATIRRARREHESIRSTIAQLAERTSGIDEEYYRERWLRRQVGSREQSPETAFADKDALYRLALARSDLLSDDLKEAALNQLVFDLETLAKGLESHFGDEETDVAAAFRRQGGEMLVSGLFAEHEPIRQAMAEVLAMARSEVWRSGEHQAQVALGRNLARAIDRMRATIEHHAQSEEIVFEQAEKALEKSLRNES